MNILIDAAFSRVRTVSMLFVMLLITGGVAYVSIPKESEPDIPIPTVHVSVRYEGISPQDSERLLVKPLEKELQSIEGLKEMRGMGAEGYASVQLEFDAGFDVEQALIKVREKVDIARAELPGESDEPRVQEVNIALFPVLTVVLSGDLPERTLVRMARDLQDKIESLDGVLEVDIGGDREELLEVLVDPSVIDAYGLSVTEIFQFVQQNNRLVAAGALDTGAGRMVLKVPGVIEDLADLQSLPIKVHNNTVVTFGDVASVRRTFKDPSGFARINGESALALEVKKRSGANIIETIAGVREVLEAEQQSYPDSVKVSYLQDKSEQISTLLGDLQNNVISAVILVMVVIVAVLGVRPSVLVGMAIPGSFLVGMLVINLMGLTLNIVVLFSLILVVGMLVDGAIVTIELADRKIDEGITPKKAYADASKRMAWPIIASTATTLIVFVPLIFWPGMVGEFMKFLPITVIITLCASLFMALIFIPVLGGMITNRKNKNVKSEKELAAIKAAESGDLKEVPGYTGKYLSILSFMLDRPGKSFLTTLGFIVLTFVGYGLFGKGVEFFPEVEPDFLQVQVQARGDLSIHERDKLVKAVENRLGEMDELEFVYTRTIGATDVRESMPEDVIGIIQLELIDWESRRKASEIIPDIREKVQNVPGILVQVRTQDNGPSAGKPIQIEVSSKDVTLIAPAVNHVRHLMDKMGGFVDIEDSRPLPSIEWKMEFDREKAAIYGVDVSLLGSVVTMITNGVRLTDYRPDDAEEEVEIRLRFPEQFRSIEQMKTLRVPTRFGSVPISNFVSFVNDHKTGRINRSNGRRVMTIKTDIEEGVLADSQVKQLKSMLAQADIADAVNIKFKGQDEEQKEAGMFLGSAFMLSLFMMTLILVTQFNSFYQAGLILSAIVFSTAGILLGLLVTGQPFGVVMGGIGVIALAGIVVNNNIVLIDTYNDLKTQTGSHKEAILRTAAQRMRPVLLTSVTTVLGLLPMVFALTIDFVNQHISVGAPSSQWWTQLSSAIAGGLTFATILTLFITPSLLMLGANVSHWRKTKSA